METLHQITLTIGSTNKKWYPGRNHVTGDTAIGVNYVAYPRVSSYQLGRLLLGNPEEIQQILSNCTKL